MILPHSVERTPLPKAILFDYDGVLVSSEPIHLQAWMQLLNELGLPWNSEGKQIIQNNIGKTAPEVLSLYLNQMKSDWKELKIDPQTLAQRKNTLFLSIAEKHLSAYPGVYEGLQWLRSMKVAVAVVSNARRRELKSTMDVLGLTEWTDEVVSRDDVPSFKPSPVPYLFAAASLGAEPRECIAVEDSPTGLEAALLAGIPTAAVITTFPRSALENPVPGRPDLKPNWICPSIQEFFISLKKPGAM